MTTLTAPPAPPPPPALDMVITLEVGPGGLDRYLELMGDRRGPRIQYLNGSLTLVSPSYDHERSASRIDHLIHGIGLILDIPFHAAGSTLWRRGDTAGIEPDGSYYIAHEAAVRGRSGPIDLQTDPPPDLIVEVVVTHGPKQSLEICAALGVPEVWVYYPQSAALEFLHCVEGVRYEARPRSLAFGFLTPSDVVPWLVEADPREPDNRWLRNLHAWIGAELAPRLAQPGQAP